MTRLLEQLISIFISLLVWSIGYLQVGHVMTNMLYVMTNITCPTRIGHNLNGHVSVTFT